MNRVLSFVREEPVRAALLPLIGALVTYLVARGALTEAMAPLILAVVAAFLGVPVTEAIRSQVTPAGKAAAAVSDAAAQVEKVLVDNAGQPPEVIVNQVRDVIGRFGR